MCFHKWSKWSDPVQTYDSHKQQWRVCEKCNKTKFRTLRWDRQTNLNDVLKAVNESRDISKR